MNKVAYAPEGARFYGSDGNVVDSVTAKNGNLRKPTIADARKNGWKPSVSEVLKARASFSLEAWKINNILNCAYDKKGEDLGGKDEWLKAVLEYSKEFTTAAADRGTEMHKQLEIYYIDGITPSDAACINATKQIDTFLKDQHVALVECEVVFSSDEYGFCGRGDIKGFREDGSKLLADFKSTDLSTYRTPYYKQGLQLGAYDLLDGGGADLYQIPIDRDSGECKFIKWGDKPTKHTPEQLSTAFVNLFSDWCIFNNYNP